MNTRIKYKPKSLEEFVFPSDRVHEEIMQYVHGGYIEPLILYGTYGSGKTLLSELIPKAIDGDSVQVTNVKAETLNNEVKACNAVRQCMDDLMGREQFIFTTNKLHNVDPGIRSRCREVEMVTAPPERFLARAKQVLKLEGVDVPEDNLLSALEGIYKSKNDNRAYYRTLDMLIYKHRPGTPTLPVLRVI